MDIVLDEDTNYFVVEYEDDENKVYVNKNGEYKCIDEHGDLFIALRNVAVNMFPNVRFRSAEYIYK